MSSGLETQKVRLKVNIKKITMNIKFPCSLTVQVKHGTYTETKITVLTLRNCMNSKTVNATLGNH